MAVPSVGDSFFVPDPNSGIAHLYVIVAVIDSKAFAVAFNFSSHDPQKSLFDPACVVESGEHPRLTERSFVVYSMGRPIPFAKWDAVLETCGGLVTGAPLGLIRKVLKGSQVSKFISDSLKSDLAPFVLPLE